MRVPACARASVRRAQVCVEPVLTAGPPHVWLALPQVLSNLGVRRSPLIDDNQSRATDHLGSALSPGGPNARALPPEGLAEPPQPRFFSRK